MNKTEYAIIVAGGKGTRIQSQTPKQFLELGGKPIILHTLEKFFTYDPNIQVILVLPADDLETWKLLVRKHNYNRPMILAEGGVTRFQSVKNGLQKIKGDGLVAIHDGVRPLVTKDMIALSFKIAAIEKCAVAAVPLKESIRMSGNATEGSLHKDSKAMDRSRFHLIQTPQTFEVGIIKSAYELPEDQTLTDDASVAERAGHTISLFQGSFANIKITTPEDLVIAEALLARTAGL